MAKDKKTDLSKQPIFDFAQEEIHHAKIKVIGCGGGGSNAVTAMMEDSIQGVEFIISNTDAQALSRSKVPVKIQLGGNITRGLGAGANPEIGRKAAMEDKDAIAAILEGSDMVFVTAGMGGGTGTGAAPIIASIAKGLGALTVGVVTKPFMFEGAKRTQHAIEGIEELAKTTDTLITIPNQRLLGLVGKNTPLMESFKTVDVVLSNAVKGIANLITVPGLINLDFADVSTIMSEMGQALMGSGVGTGENKAIEAAQKAIHSPMLEETSIEGAKGILVNLTGGPDLSVHDVNDAVMEVQKSADKNVNIIFGAVIDPTMEGEVMVTVIATGFNSAHASRAAVKESVQEEFQPNVVEDESAKENGKPALSILAKPEQSNNAFPSTNWEHFDDELDKPAFLRRQAD